MMHYSNRIWITALVVEEGFRNLNCKVYFQFKKDVYDFYLVKNFHLIMLGIMKLVREFVLIKSTRHQKVTAWSTLNQSLMNIKY